MTCQRESICVGGIGTDPELATLSAHNVRKAAMVLYIGKVTTDWSEYAEDAARTWTRKWCRERLRDVLRSCAGGYTWPNVEGA